MSNHDHLQQFVEKEKTRELFLSAVRSGSPTEYWRQILIIVVFIGAIGATFATRTQRFRDVMDKLSADPLKDKRGSIRSRVPRPGIDPDQFVDGANSAWVNQEKFDKAQKESENGAAPDGEGVPEELLNSQKSREALGRQLEAVGEGRAMPPSAAAVNAAMEGKAMPPQQVMFIGSPAPAAPPTALAPAQRGTSSVTPKSSGEVGISPGEREQPPVMELSSSPGAPIFRQLKQIPATYAREKQEFPDAP